VIDVQSHSADAALHAITYRMVGLVAIELGGVKRPVDETEPKPLLDAVEVVHEQVQPAPMEEQVGVAVQTDQVRLRSVASLGVYVTTTWWLAGMMSELPPAGPSSQSPARATDPGATTWLKGALSDAEQPAVPA
jgi:hypothetical protein